jgi:flagellar basal-body rod protein FlgB
MSLIDSAGMEALTRFLDVASARQKAVTTNIANLDTPGYRTKDIDFRQMLLQHTAGLSDSSSVSTKPPLREVAGLLERPDGNNVSMDREGLLLAQTQLQFQTGVQLLRSEFKRIQLAINEGK